MAAACDDGVLRIFTAEGLEPGLSYAKSLPALGSRLLSVAWHPDGQSLITGTAAGTLHAWHLASGRELLRINVGARLRQPILRVPQPASILPDGICSVGNAIRKGLAVQPTPNTCQWLISDKKLQHTLGPRKAYNITHWVKSQDAKSDSMLFAGQA